MSEVDAPTLPAYCTCQPCTATATLRLHRPEHGVWYFFCAEHAPDPLRPYLRQMRL